jgi:hypothetical protein
MFGKTREKIVKPIRDAMQMALMALGLAFMALFVAIFRAA